MAQITVETAEGIPEGYIPVETAVVMKCLDPDGCPTLLIRNSAGMAVWEAVGMFVTASDMARKEAGHCFVPLDEEDD